MNKLYALLLFLLFIPIFGMDQQDLPEFTYIRFEDSKYPMYESPGQLIDNHIQYPTFIQIQLKKYRIQQLLNFRQLYSHNNLLHCIIKNLAEKKESLENFSDLIEEYKPILTWLVSIGLDVNEVNDNRTTPLMFVYRAQTIVDFQEKGNKIQSLIDYLEHDLHAKPTYLSLDPEIRLCNNFLWKLFTCQCCKKQKYS